MKKLALILILFLITPAVYSVGIGGKTLRDTVIFEPNLEKTYTYAAIPNAPRTMDYGAQVKGDLKDYITLSDTHFESLSKGDMGVFTATLSLPQDLEPGSYTSKICVSEGSTRTGGQIGAKTNACATINVRSLDYNKRIKATLSAENVGENEPIPFTLRAENWGRQDIDSVSAKINIYNTDLIDSIYTDTASIPSGGSETLKATYSKGLGPGTYNAKAEIFFDSDSIEAETEFKIGTLSVDIVNHSQTLYANDKNELVLTLQNNWNKEIKGVYADVKFKEATLKTTVTDLNPFSTSDTIAYWDTSGLQEGTYEAEVILHYEGKESTETISIDLIKKPLFSGGAVAIPANASILLVLLVLIAMVAIGYHFYKRGKNEEL